MRGKIEKYVMMDGEKVKCFQDYELHYVEFYDPIYGHSGDPVRCSAWCGKVLLYTGIEVRTIGLIGRDGIDFGQLYRLAKTWIDALKTAYAPGEYIGIVERRIPDVWAD